MLEDEEYPSDSDQSDDDYRPDTKDADPVSEEESDGEPEENGSESVTQIASRKRKATNSKSNAKHTEEVKKATGAAVGEDEEVSKARADALWADFLSGTDDPIPSKSSKPTQSTKSKVETKPEEKIPDKKPPTEPVKKQTVKELFEFAGEIVEVEKEVTQTSNSIRSDDGPSQSGEPQIKRPRVAAVGAGGGLNAILGQLGKKNKLSVLEKTNLDWKGFKKSEGIDEELQIHNKGRDGYLERQDFLERTDLRRFEIEKGMRQTNRRK